MDGEPRHVYRLREIEGFLHERRASCKVPDSVPTSRLLDALLDDARLRRVVVDLPYRREVRYVWRDADPLTVALSLKPHAYLSHFSALAIHDLTEQVPKTIYINVEQRPQVSNPASLTQQGLDRAFRNPQRLTSNAAQYQDYRIVVINGKHTGQLGVIDHRHASGEAIRVTDPERTLIDAAVRPAYAGGVGMVAKAYQRAVERVSWPRVAELLKTLSYVYPYHQAVGFYVERAGAPPEAVACFRRDPMRFDFYLAHGLRETAFVDRWRLHVPRGFE